LLRRFEAFCEVFNLPGNHRRNLKLSTQNQSSEAFSPGSLSLPDHQNFITSTMSSNSNSNSTNSSSSSGKDYTVTSSGTNDKVRP
jgi:hypothetical protein